MRGGVGVGTGRQPADPWERLSSKMLQLGRRGKPKGEHDQRTAVKVVMMDQGRKGRQELKTHQKSEESREEAILGKKEKSVQEP